ncbi:hypothetical protein WMY93_013193 [Mugilogobius chulae]|uniref:Uncharacterized protein n=1 Tax=Mugilogobius chulae TaxID=88201 RepID=A0AAW0P9A6_9GOBI
MEKDGEAHSVLFIYGVKKSPCWKISIFQMGQFSKVTTVLVFLVLTFHQGLVQELTQTTQSPRKTINPAWFRNPLLNENQSGTQAPDSSGVGQDDSSGTIGSGSGSFTIETFDEENQTLSEISINGTSVPLENLDTNSSASTPLPTTDRSITNSDDSTTAPEDSTDNSTNADVQPTTEVPNATTQDSVIQNGTDMENNATATTQVIPTTTEEIPN